jgi:hypothetical protein
MQGNYLRGASACNEQNSRAREIVEGGLTVRPAVLAAALCIAGCSPIPTVEEWKDTTPPSRFELTVPRNMDRLGLCLWNTLPRDRRLVTYIPVVKEQRAQVRVGSPASVAGPEKRLYVLELKVSGPNETVVVYRGPHVNEAHARTFIERCRYSA